MAEFVNRDEQDEDDTELPAEECGVEEDRCDKREAREQKFTAEEQPFEIEKREEQAFEFRKKEPDPDGRSACGLPAASRCGMFVGALREAGSGVARLG